MRLLLPVTLAGVLALGGCSVAPPTPLEDEAAFAELCALPASEFDWEAHRLAIAPVSLTYLSGGEELDAAGPGAGRDESSRRVWTRPPLDGAALGDRLQMLASKVLCGGQEVLSLDPESRDALRSADDSSAAVVVQLEVLENQIAWVERDAPLWWVNQILFSVGVLPMAFVPDEVYEGRIVCRVVVRHVRSGQLLYSAMVGGRHRRALNDPQRGWSLSSLVGVHPELAVPGESDYGEAYRALLPHVLKDLELALFARLRADLPEVMDRSRVKELLVRGTTACGRTYAIVVGHDGPREGASRPQLRYAGRDAQAVAEALRATGTARTSREFRTAKGDHIELLLQEEATPERILEAVRRLGRRLLWNDRLVFYYAGYGSTDHLGEAVLVLGDHRLSLHTLEDWFREALVQEGNSPSVAFILDTSFGDAPKGRNFVEAQEGARSYSSHPHLVHPELRWSSLTAAGQRGIAYEIEHAMTPEEEHGHLTYSLLAALRGAADAGESRDGVITLRELFDFVLERVPSAIRLTLQDDQIPELQAAEAPMVVAFPPG